MKKIQFNNKEFNIPQKWDEITLEQQIKVSDIVSIQSHVKMLSILSAYTGIPVQELKTSPIYKVEKVMQHLKFINEPIPSEPVLKFLFKDEYYYITENIIEQQFQDYISIQTILMENKDNIWKALPFMIAVLAKKEGETLDDYDVYERAEEFKQLPLPIVNGINSFFLSSKKVLEYSILLSSQENQIKIVEEKEKELKNLLKQSDQHTGGTLFTRWLITLYKKLILLFVNRLVKYFKSSQSNTSKKI